MKFILYVDGQLGLHFDNLNKAKEAAAGFRAEGYDTHIIGDRPEYNPNEYSENGDKNG